MESPTAIRVPKAALSDEHVRLQDGVNERHSYSMEPKKLLKEECRTAWKLCEFPSKLLTGHNMASKNQSTLYELIEEIDTMLNQIAAEVSVDIMPLSGLHDPANFALPQQPLNRCLFSGSAPYITFWSCRNPHSSDVDNLRFLGTSGQSIHDPDKHSEVESKLDFVKRTLRWRHLTPTAPNILRCYNFTDIDRSFI
ncbi:hypothetical protein Bca52824_096513 [Brassica carinata]|uniref:DNA polymerase alpha/delta/epsilon subunit B domain-containing protein n=1 Tax=Brassica carinata TaxID=52824 RepID=A0A8X7NWS4_BRACI|nr:hypothetical protein Bca52824_096513 [Brassica carinata]